MKYVPGERFQPPPPAKAWASEYFCSSCGWRAKLDADPRRCPKCRHVTQREMNSVDRLIASPSRVFAIGLVVGVFGWLLWTLSSSISLIELVNFGGQTDIVASLRCSQLIKTDEGYSARFRLHNPSIRDLEEIVVYVTVKWSRETPETAPVVTEGKLIFETADGGSVVEADLAIPPTGSGTPDSWTARVGSFELPRRFQNTARQILATLTLEGDLETNATRFPFASIPKKPAEAAEEPATADPEQAPPKNGDPKKADPDKGVPASTIPAIVQPATEAPTEKTPEPKEEPAKAPVGETSDAKPAEPPAAPDSPTASGKGL
jgi:hypothetical protein